MKAKCRRVSGLRQLVGALCVVFTCMIGGCNRKSTTRITISPPAAPVQLTFCRKEEGLWQITGGIGATDLGFVSIEQTIDTRDDFTYIVFRNRKHGTDQTFKIGSKGHIELHTTGEHRLNLQRNNNEIVVDDNQIDGNIEVTVTEDGSAVSKLDFPAGPELTFYQDHRLGVGYNSVFVDDQTISLDSIQKITYHRDLGARYFLLTYKDGLQEGPRQLLIDATQNTNESQLTRDVAAFRTSVHTINPGLAFVTETSRRNYFVAIAIVSLPICAIVALRKWQTRLNKKRLSRWISIPLYYLLGWAEIMCLSFAWCLFYNEWFGGWHLI